jgi:DNA-binding transcriptional ArsR family regulator
MAYQSQALLALGDPTRLAIVERLVERPLAVVDLARELPVSRPAVSQHLRILKDAGLVIDEPAGNRRIYRIDLDALAALRGHLDQFWEKALAAYNTSAVRVTANGRRISALQA